MGPLVFIMIAAVELAFAYDYYDKKVREKK